MFRVGQLAIIVAPGEATTMAGRRWKAAVADELDKLGIISKESGWTVIGGPANSYTHYIATPEEYAIQRYEGASTLYGQFTYVSENNSLFFPVPLFSPLKPPLRTQFETRPTVWVVCLESF